MTFYDYADRIKKELNEDSAIQDVIIAYWDKMYELTKKYNPKAMRERVWGALFEIELYRNLNQKYSLTIMRRGTGFGGIMDVYDEIWQFIKPYVENIIKTVPNISGISSYANITPFLKYVPDLTFLDLSGCPNMRNFSPQIWTLKKLRVLYISAPKIKEIPDEIRFLSRLKNLELGDCDSLIKISPFTAKLPNLKTLIVRDCPKLNELPEIFLDLPDHIDLKIRRCENLENGFFL